MNTQSTLVWTALIGLTCLTYASPTLGLAAGTLVVLTLITAMVKAQLVADRFMGLAKVGGFWRYLVMGYLLAVGAGIAGAFFL